MALAFAPLVGPLGGALRPLGHRARLDSTGCRCRPCFTSTASSASSSSASPAAPL
eukprot:CAMPEP_0203923980 /NCGR_PEP_ID=MMETSP0359-20131031/63795_1 /ASSEMBLY_ACC=CAM_ASM_000338 /TAXON_ID=268821 /ORGANISM="Scrippsiella Hangoei, Strain SHTV-5" /LENGTH=54 /DNA_ID=CAMNT_0050852137 /DNA_START=22 /DNA_END=183 /DNA_ORIENTATION=-